MASPLLRAQVVATTNAVPWFCGFEVSEGYTNEMVLNEGFGGWYSADSNAFVQDADFCNDSPFIDSLMSVAIGEDETLSNRFDGTFTNNLWIQMDVRAGLDEGDDPPETDTNSTVMFYIQSNGFFSVNHMTNYAEPTNGNWVVLSNTVTGTEAVPYETNTWVRLNIMQNQLNKTWALFVDYKLITNSINFVNTNVSAFNGFDVYNGGGATSYLDNISITNGLPPDLAADGGDWLPDLNVTATNFNRNIFAGETAEAGSYEIWKTTNYYDLVFSNWVSTSWVQVATIIGTNNGLTHTLINVTFNGTENLPAGDTYTAQIVVSGWDPEFGFTASGSSKTIDVSVATIYPPVLAVAPTTFSHEVSEGHKPSGDSFRVWNDSLLPREVMNYTVSSDKSWMIVSPTNGVCQYNTNAVAVAYNTASLAPGWYTGTVTVTSSGAGASSKEVVVSLRVNARPVLSTDAAGWTNIIKIGELWDDASFNIWNSSIVPRATMKYQVSDDLEWVTLSSGSGTSTGEQHEITLSFETEGLIQGIYTGAVIVTAVDDVTYDTATGSPQQFGIELTVLGNVALATSLNGFTNTVLEGYSATNSFSIWNTGGEPWSRMAYTVAKDVSWFTLSSSSGTVSNETNAISVVFSSSGLEPGVYTGSITVDATDVESGSKAPGAPRTKTVTFTVASRTPVNFELPEVNGVAHVGQSLTVDNGMWQYENRLTFSYQWQRATTVYGDEMTDIPGAVGSSYIITENDKNSWLRVKVTAVDSEPTALSTTVYSEFKSSTRTKVVPDDFSGDGKSDLWFFDSLYGMWRISYVSGGTAELQFGSWETDAVPGDYDGNGVMDFAVYHQTEGTWYVLFMPDGRFAYLQFGWWDTVPIPADYDGDGTTDIAVYWPEGGIWYILRSTTWNWDYTQFGWSETTPVPADYTGDGKTDMAIYYNGTWIITSESEGQVIYEFGGLDAIAAPGDYDGDGIADLAVYWYAENRWEIQESSTGNIRELTFGTSNGAGVPSPGYFDSDNLLDPATVHVSGEFLVWCIQRSQDGYRGQSYQSDLNTWRVAW